MNTNNNALRGITRRYLTLRVLTGYFSLMYTHYTFAQSARPPHAAMYECVNADAGLCSCQCRQRSLLHTFFSTISHVHEVKMIDWKTEQRQQSKTIFHFLSSPSVPYMSELFVTLILRTSHTYIFSFYVVLFVFTGLYCVRPIRQCLSAVLYHPRPFVHTIFFHFHYDGIKFAFDSQFTCRSNKTKSQKKKRNNTEIWESIERIRTEQSLAIAVKCSDGKSIS